MSRCWLAVLAATIAAGPALPETARSSVPTPEFPLALYGNESVAATDGANGFLVNPAAGGIRYPSELLLAFTEIEPDRTLARGMWSVRGFGFGVSRLEGGDDSYTLGLSAGKERFRLGWSASLLAGAGGGRALDHALGLLARPVPWLSLGGTLAHAGAPRLAGARLDRTVTYGVGLRPLALSRGMAHTWGPRLTVTGDVLMREGAESGQARVRLGGELEIVSGLGLRGAVEDHGGVQVGFALLGTRSGYHARAAYDRDGHRRSVTHALSFHRGEDRSVLAGPRERRIAEVRVSGALGDESLAGVSLFGGGGTRAVRPIHEQLERALEDPLTRGVLLDLRGVSTMAQIEELRPRIARLRAAGKPVVAFMEYGGGRGDLYLAGACDRIVTTEEASFAALGLRAERRYYRRLLADWGVRFDRSSFGPYKSAYRNFSTDSTPAADREAIEHLLDVQQELFVAALCGDRAMDRARLLPLLDGRWWPPAQLRQAGLVDSIGYREDAMALLGRLCGLGEKPRRVELQRTPASRRAWMVPARIAVVYASGGIETGRSGGDLLNGPFMGSETIIPQLEHAFRDRDVRAVVLRVESPGGSGLASNLIHHAAARLKRETRKPFIVSMGSTAASGGYYIALHGDRVFADRFTRTGSIGVLFVKPSLEEWYDRHRVRQDEFERGPFMGGWSLGRDWDAAFQASADSTIRHLYRSFVSRVAERRKLSWGEADAVAQGRVWMGEDALERKLVDEIGGLEEAIAEARRRAGVPASERIRIAEYRRPRPGFLQRVIGAELVEMWDRSVRLPEPGTVYYRSDVGED